MVRVDVIARIGLRSAFALRGRALFAGDVIIEKRVKIRMLDEQLCCGPLVRVVLEHRTN